MQKLNKTKSKQIGAALIFLVAIVSIIILILTLDNLNAKKFDALRKEKTATAMFEAKSALLGWSVLRGISGVPSTATPGQLPCPEDLSLLGTANEGSSMTSCNSAAPVVGRLPWRSLGLGDLRDGNGDKLWYAISTGFRNAPINSNSLGQLNIDGNLNAAVAIIFSPGAVLAGQNRSVINAANFLDLTNNDADTDFATAGNIQNFNDVLITVKHDELFQLVEKRILNEIRGDTTQGLVRYYTSQGVNNYPFADTDNDGTVNLGQLLGNPTYEGVNNLDPDNLFFNTRIKNILVSNGWMQNISYQVSADLQTVTMSSNSQTITVVP